MKILKQSLIGIVVVLVAIQFIHPKKNISGDVSPNRAAASEEVQKILATSCNDCHSNNTIYPWYNNIQPVAWWLNHHIKEAKHDLNFDEFLSYSPRMKYHKMEELEKVIKEDKMPLPSYLWIHRYAALDVQQKEVLVNWSKLIRIELEAQYPKDSLIFKKPTNRP